VDTSTLYELYLAHPSVQTDSRKLQKGDLFFALKGPSFDANTFAMQALEAAASFAIIDDPKFQQDERCILVPDVLKALQDLARHHRNQFQIPFLAITGSNGKTTTKELVTAVLRQKFKTYATKGNLNNHIGIPLTILDIHPDAEFAVIEMGANHLHEIESYCLIAAPSHGLITNCGKAHIEGFGSLEGVRKGKGELYDYLREHQGMIFRNTDLDYLEEMAKGIEQQICYGTMDADIIGSAGLNGIFLEVKVEVPEGMAPVTTQLVGAYNFPNAMAAVAIGLHFGVEPEAIRTALAIYQPDNSRSQWMKRGSNEIILDAYNANPTSMKAAIESFAVSNFPHKRLWLGAMKEMGSSSLEEHAALVQLAEKTSWDQLILVGDEFNPVKGTHTWFKTATEAALYVKKDPPEGAAILIKGSRGSKMESLLEAVPQSHTD